MPHSDPSPSAAYFFPAAILITLLLVFGGGVTEVGSSAPFYIVAGAGIGKLMFTSIFGMCALLVSETSLAALDSTCTKYEPFVLFGPGAGVILFMVFTPMLK